MTSLVILRLAVLAVLAAVLLAAAVQDWRTRHIANNYPLAVILLFVASATMGVAWGRFPVSSIAASLAGAALVFAVGVAAFAAGALGGGDVKLLTAVSLFAGPAHLPQLLAITALTGGALALAVLAGVRIGVPVDPDKGLRSRLRYGLPYGPAIAAGGIWLAVSVGLSAVR